MLGLVMVGPHVTDMVEAGVIAIDAGATVETVADAMAVTAFAAAQYAIGRPLAPEAWLAIAPLLASLALGPLRTALMAGWTVLLGLALALAGPAPAGRLASSLAVLALLAGFGVANSVLRSAAQRRLGQARAVARVIELVICGHPPAAAAEHRR